MQAFQPLAWKCVRGPVPPLPTALLLAASARAGACHQCPPHTQEAGPRPAALPSVRASGEGVAGF